MIPLHRVTLPFLLLISDNKASCTRHMTVLCARLLRQGDFADYEIYYLNIPLAHVLRGPQNRSLSCRIVDCPLSNLELKIEVVIGYSISGDK
jgi:hypothetical protein